jgi:hypothetical protein
MMQWELSYKGLSLLTLIVDTMLVNRSIRILRTSVNTAKNLHEHT